MPTLTLDGRRLAYLDAGGPGPALLLVHAFPLRGAMWRAQLDALAPKVRGLAPDLPGFGGSEAGGAPSVDAWADLLAQLLDALSIERAIVGGCSMGGYVALAFARRHPGRLSGLLLTDTRAEADTPEGKAKREATITQTQAEGTGPLCEAMLPNLLSKATHEQRPDLVSRVRGLMDASPAGVIDGVRALRDRPDARPGLGAIAVPTAVIVGEHDAITPPPLAEALAAAIPGAQLTVIPGAGHLPSIEAPQPFEAALRALLTRVG